MSLNWPDISNLSTKIANAIYLGELFIPKILFPIKSDVAPAWMKTEILPKTKSIPKRAVSSDIQRKKDFIILLSIETLLREVWPLLKRLDKGKILKYTSKIMWFLESDFPFLIEAK